MPCNPIKMKNLPSPEIWFVTGSQHLYGEAALKQVAANSQQIVAIARRLTSAEARLQAGADHA